jgi:uncharacterized protein YjbJ (UPF0337 family)
MGDKDVFEGKMKQAEGKVQDAFGDLTGSPEQDARGKTKQVEGKIQEGYGRLQNAIKDTDDVDDEDDVVR